MISLASTAEAHRARVRVRGLVQGVGFRPFVFELAHRYALTGWVKNDDEGVVLEVQGAPVPRFLDALRRESPPLARVDRVEVEPLPWSSGETTFEIRASAHVRAATTEVGPDAAPCRACLAELFDPADRRYLYPFLNCTHCGPRYTLTRRLPYDRASTSMAPFPMCASCAREYGSPTDRRFHAQPTACPACGPRLSMPLEEIVARLRSGGIVALKAVGGFQLACDATSSEAVARLRRLKQRDGKPFAVMCASRASAEAWVAPSEQEAALLESPRRPVVLVARRTGGASLAAEVAPDLAWIGMMLPSSPLHYLVFHEAAGRPVGLDWLERPLDLALVMTSANPGGEPMLVDDEEARRRLEGIADAIVVHDREIVVRCDDPVARVVAGTAMTLRRGRGATPAPIRLGRSFPPVLATGGQLKDAICLIRDDEAFLSQHLGDLDRPSTYAFFERTIEHLRHLLGIAPAAVAHDLHPDLLSTRYAQSLGLPAVAVQHHHAHVASVLAEHGREGPHLGWALDGVGLGTDGAAWGGELLLVDGARFERRGHLAALPLPGGDAAAREPWRLAVGALWRLGKIEAITRRWGARGAALVDLLDRGARCPPATGCGRWFDAAAALLGVRERSGYEGEAPMVLESLVRTPWVLPGGWRVDGDALELLPLLEALLEMSPQRGADAFHGTLAAALVDFTSQRLSGPPVVALGGGCIANGTLTRELVAGFRRIGVEVLLPREAPPGDGGLALGQAWVCAHAIGGD